MKIKNLLQFVLVLFIGQFLFSCSSAEYYKFSPDKPEAYNTTKAKPTPSETNALLAPTVAEVMVSEEASMPAPEAPALMASTAAKVVSSQKAATVVEAPAVKEEVTLEKREMTVAEAEALAMAKERLSNMTKAEKKELKNDMREVMRQQGGGANIVEIILAILLPPLAVFLHDGIGTSFWINIILTLLFVLPGIIHALLVVTDTI